MPDYRRLVGRKARPKKINRKQGQANKFLPKIILLLILTGIVVALFLAGKSFLIHSPSFQITEVSVIDQKAEALANPQDYLRLEDSFNLFSLDVERLVRDIRARHPELADVYIRRQFPNKITVVVKKRQPVAIIDLKDSYFVDAEAVIFPLQSPVPDLPRIIGIPSRQIKLYSKSDSLILNKALSLVQEFKQTGIYPEYQISQIDLRQPLEIIVYLEDEIEVKMGQGSLSRKIVLLSKILAQLKQSNTVPKYIDMRFDNPVVKP